ncbi:hypothetical protein QR680_008900 [Steinernema hermaphroditum]|uniref:Uncharacterized protein n=1 Tax=Steinernema hermaphroditum TaxID=289476 RepID=A0AA39IJQ6_9BILA|nr:hypothetical protein QR680_008900 [Steinernema hermaphroditum]
MIVCCLRKRLSSAYDYINDGHKITWKPHIFFRDAPFIPLKPLKITVAVNSHVFPFLILTAPGNFRGNVSSNQKKAPASQMDHFTMEKQHAFLLVVSSVVVLLNVLCIFGYLRRPVTSSRCGTLFSMFSTRILYGLMTISSSALWLLPREVFFGAIFGNTRLLLFSLLTPHLAEQIVSVSTALFALDRVLVLTTTLRYSLLRLSERLALVALVVNATTLAYFYGTNLILSDSEDLEFVFFTDKILKYCVFPITLLSATVLHLVFVFQYRLFYTHKKNRLDKKQAIHANHMVMFQMVAHTLLCAVPNALSTLNSPFIRLEIERIDLMERYNGAMFGVSLLLSSLFALYELRPHKVFLQIVSTRSPPSTAPGR